MRQQIQTIAANQQGGGPGHFHSQSQDMRSTYEAQIAAGNHDQAFKCALNLRNLPDVMWLCQQVDPGDPNVKLSDTVLLPLLHQLSFTISGDEDHSGLMPLTVRWMQHCALHLSDNESLVGRHIHRTCQHVRSVLEANKGLFSGCMHDYHLLLFMLASLSK